LDGDTFKPSNAKAIANAQRYAPVALRGTAIPAWNIHLEIAALQSPIDVGGQSTQSWNDLLAQDVSTLRSDVNVANDINNLGCDYSENVANAIRSLQDDIDTLAAVITKAKHELATLTFVASRQAGGDVATVRAEIATRTATVDQDVRQANVLVGEANADAPKVENFLQQAECGAIHIGFHLLLDAGE
jgi:ABC-type transporter Mla subunit MlaD